METRRPHRPPVGANKTPPRKNSAPVGAGKPPYGNKGRPDRVTKPSPEKKPAASDARKIALSALGDVTRGQAYSTLALNEHLRQSVISPEDKRLATSLFYTTLENLIRIDYVLSQLIQRMPEPIVQDILRIAVAQLLLMDKVPDHAAVNEAMLQVKLFKRDAVRGMVNGVLRSLIRLRDAREIHYPKRDDNPVKYLSIMHSIPEHLAQRLVNQYGLEFAERMIEYRPDERWETIRPNLLRIDEAAFEEYAKKRGWQAEKGIVPGVLRVKSAGDLPGDPDYRSGLFSIQGEGSLLAAMALEPKRAQNLLDACAAPGGKAAYLCERMNGTGRVQAWDVHEHRVEMLRAVKERLKLENLRPMQRDACVPREDLYGTFDGVIVDAPCSGLGVMINKPDIKYRVTDADIESLVALQARILDACCAYVAPGGLLVYSTCTVLCEENERQVERFLAAHPEFTMEEDVSYLPELLKSHAQGGMIQIHAHRDGLEGFFIARMRRRKTG